MRCCLYNPIVEKPTTKRMTALDQFRGYAVAGMVLVNFLGNYACAPRILRHTNDYCSYADTIMPNFLFAVGFSIAVVWYRALSKAASAMGLEIGGLDARSVRGVAREVQWKPALDVTRRCRLWSSGQKRRKNVSVCFELRRKVKRDIARAVPFRSRRW